MRHSWMVPVALLGIVSCFVGPTTKTFAPGNGPAGVAAELRLMKQEDRVRGEVLEVQDTALVLLSANRIVLVPIRVIAVGQFRHRGTPVADGRVSREALARVRLVSRYPAGMAPEIRARLLAAYGQTEPDVAP